MKTPSKDVRGLIKDVKRRWKLRILRQGLSVAILTFVPFAAVYLLLSSEFELSLLFQSIAITVMAVILLIEIVQLIVRPLLKSFSDRKIALFIEEKIPELEDRVNSAAEVNKLSGDREKNILIDKLIDDAKKKIRSVQLSTVVGRKKEKLLSYIAYGLLAAFILLVFIFSDDIGGLTSNIQFSLNPKTHFGQEIIEIVPGDIQIEKGESVDVVAELKSASDDDFILHFKAGEDIWQKESMAKGLDSRTFMCRLMSIQEPTTYYVEHDDMRSREFRISIYVFPKVAQIDLKYSYPIYTGLPVRYEENTGNIRGLQGSEVTLTIETTGAAVKGELVINDAQRIPLKAAGNGVFQGSLTLRDPAVYYVKLTDREDKNNKFPEEYQVTPVADELPLVTITDPQRDVRVNAVEEVLLSASISDDFGISSANLKYSVNAAEEQSIDLIGNVGKGTTEASGSHLFFLEDFSLEPGDVISYYVEAQDHFHKEDPALTDMYFIEVIPFDASYSQVNNRGGGAAGQQGSQTVINQQTIINATWKLYRQRRQMTPADFEEASDALVQAQSNLKDNIDRRINSTAFSLELITDEEYKEIVDLLRNAVKSMESAVDLLEGREHHQALTPERQALNYLLKADAKNKEKMIQRGQMAGGGGSPIGEDRMTELMDLELDISKDKYEIKQQSQQQQNQEINEALEKLRELAKKQQMLAQQSRNNLQQEENRRELDRLKRDQEKLRNDSENLANQMRQMSRDNQQITSQMQERIARITEMMRQAEQEMKRDNIQQSMAKQSQALNELDRLQRDMRLSLTDNTREMLDQFTENFDNLKNQERELARSIKNEFDELQESSGKSLDIDDVGKLAQTRQHVIDNLQSLEDQAQSIERQTRQENPKTSTDFRNIQNTIKREGIEKNMENSKDMLERGWLTYAHMIEDDIGLGIERLEKQIRELESGLPVAEEEKLNRSLEDTRDMMRRLEEAVAQNRQDGQQEQQQRQRENQQAENSSQGRDRNASARMSRLLDQARQMLERMEREYGNDPDMRQRLENTRRSFASQSVGTLIGENGEEYFKKGVYDPLSQLETDILKRLDEIELEKKLYGMRKEKVPAEYRRLVDKYFESIAK
jgi:hypothetical protein